jgi:hypothetical protein
VFPNVVKPTIKKFLISKDFKSVLIFSLTSVVVEAKIIPLLYKIGLKLNQGILTEGEGSIRLTSFTN